MAWEGGCFFYFAHPLFFWTVTEHLHCHTPGTSILGTVTCLRRRTGRKIAYRSLDQSTRCSIFPNCATVLIRSLRNCVACRLSPLANQQVIDTMDLSQNERRQCFIDVVHSTVTAVVAILLRNDSNLLQE